MTVDSQQGTSRNANPHGVLRQQSNTIVFSGRERSLRDGWLGCWCHARRVTVVSHTTNKTRAMLKEKPPTRDA